MLRGRPKAVRQLLGSIGTAFVELLPLSSDEAGRIQSVMEQCENRHPQLADACLVYLAHREKIDTVFTLDRRDFSVYRAPGRKPFHLLP